MNDSMRARLTQLKGEYENGEARLRAMLQQEASLRETLLRISGAIQVLEELLADDQAGEGDTDEEAAAASEPVSDADARPADGEPVTMTVP